MHFGGSEILRSTPSQVGELSVGNAECRKKRVRSCTAGSCNLVTVVAHVLGQVKVF